MSPSNSHSKYSNVRHNTRPYHKSPVGTPKSMLCGSNRMHLQSMNPESSGNIGDSLVCEPGTPTKERGEPQNFSLSFNLYSPKKNKPTQEPNDSQLEPETPELRFFHLPVTDQILDISECSLADLKNKLFVLADDIDPNQIGDRNSSLLKAADTLGLVSIQAYIEGHSTYDINHYRLLIGDADVARFFEEVRIQVDQVASLVVSMADPMIGPGKVLVPETLPATHSETHPTSKDGKEVSVTPSKNPEPLMRQDVPVLNDPNDLNNVHIQYLSFQGESITVDHHTIVSLRSKLKLSEYLEYLSLPQDEIQDVMDILRPHRINSFEKFLFPEILNVDHLVKWRIRFGTAMDIMFKARQYYQSLVLCNINSLPDHLKGGYVEFQGQSITINRDTVEFLIGRTSMIEYLLYAGIPTAEIQTMMEIFKPHRIDSFAKFLYPTILNVNHLVDWGVRFGTAMDLMFRSRDFYQHLIEKERRKGTKDIPLSSVNLNAY